MIYNELLQFEPINEAVKFARLSDDEYCASLVRNFVFSEEYENNIIPELCNYLDYSAGCRYRGLMIVGTQGTGKSHLMSLFSLIAENEEYLPLVQNDRARHMLGTIAGKYKVVRLELGRDDELWHIIRYQIAQKLKEWGIDYFPLSDDRPDMFDNKLHIMMEQFEEAFPSKGLLVVVDEMSSYLKGHATHDRLIHDLQFLQVLNQMSCQSKFCIVFGVQTLSFNNPRFQFTAAEMFGKVVNRYDLIVIHEHDVQQRFRGTGTLVR